MDPILVRTPLALIAAAAFTVGACSGLLGLDKVTVGRWIGTTKPGATDGSPRIDQAAALEVARLKLAQFHRRGWTAHRLEDLQPVAAGFVPSLSRIDSLEGDVTFVSTPPADSWVFEFGERGRGAIVIVDADTGEVAQAGGT